MFRLANTWENTATPASVQRGFPAPGAEEQATGDPSFKPFGMIPWSPQRPTQGKRSWFMPASRADNRQRGFAQPEEGPQLRPPGSMPNIAPPFGGVYQHYTPYYDRGAAAYVPNFGRQLTNPIGAGVVALFRTKASYGPAAQYANGAIWWTSQSIPTSVNLQGLTDPEELAAQFSQTTVQAMVRTTG